MVPVCALICAHARSCMCAYVSMNAPVCVHECYFACAFVCAYAFTLMSMRICIHTCEYALMHSHLCIGVSMRACNYSITAQSFNAYAFLPSVYTQTHSIFSSPISSKSSSAEIRKLNLQTLVHIVSRLNHPPLTAYILHENPASELCVVYSYHLSIVFTLFPVVRPSCPSYTP